MTLLRHYSPSSAMMMYLAVLFLLCTCSYVRPQAIERFTISTTASFKQDATAGGNENCTYCDCTAASCKWVNNFTCTNPASYAAYGADDAQQRWGNCASGNCFCFGSSGIGFQGVKDVVIYSNVNSSDITRIGRVTHYNNAIYSGDSPTRLRLTLTITSPQLQQPFIIAYPLKFIETLNTGDVLTCDPSIQRTNVSCDDRFSFEKLYISSSFVYNNIQYTLEAVGFLNANDLNTPLKQFVTKEGSATRADIYARIVTYCVDTDCKANEIFQTSPCGCVCGLTEDICNTALTEDWGFDNDTCNCVCKKNETTACGTNGVLNTDTCGCDCNITEAYCAALNPLYGASLAPACGCDCKRQKFLDCYAENPFYVPDKDKLCVCTCQVSDGACEQTYGSGYTADFAACACIPPGGDGLSGGDIAGIVIGSLVGAGVLFVLVLALGALLVWLIRSGKIPGIYGYKIDVADLNTAQQSPFYKDVWAGNNNAMAE